MDLLAAWLLFPLTLVVTAAGVGLLAERLVGVELPAGLTAPFGVCASIGLLMPVYRLGFGADVGAPVLVLVAGAGLLLHRTSLRRQAQRVLGGWAGVAALAVLVLYMAPAALTGGWTWVGYNFVNDTAFHFVLTDWIGRHGFSQDVGSRTTTSEVVLSYLGTAYPLGTHVHIATLCALTATPVAVVFQTYVAMLGVAICLGLAALARQAGLGAPQASVVGAVGAAANLTYNYAQQGNVKEMGILMALVCAVAIGGRIPGSAAPARLAALTGVALAAALSVFGFGGVPYMGLVGLVLLIAMLVSPGGAASLRRLPPTIVAGALVLGLAALPALTTVQTSSRSLQGTFAAAGKETELAQLARPLPALESAGIWLNGDYRLPVHGDAYWIMSAGIVLVLVAGAGALAVLLWRRTWGPALLLIVTLGVALAASPRTSPYGDGKLLAILAPAIVSLGMTGAFMVARRSRVPGIVLAVAIGGLVLYSDALSYHEVRLAPTSRMDDLSDIGERYAGRGLLLQSEYEEFGKYFMREARINAGTEAITGSFVQLRGPGDFFGRSFDLDEETLAYVEGFPYLLVRRKGNASRPPADYVLDYRNRSYEVWRKRAGPHVLEHLPLGSRLLADGFPSCGDVRALARRARPGQRLLAAARPESTAYDFAASPTRPREWTPDVEKPGWALMSAPARDTGVVRVAGGTYIPWLSGSFGRRMEIRIDGRTVGSVKGINTPGGALATQPVELAPGRHTVEVIRRKGSFGPGDGARSAIGALVLAAEGEHRLVTVAPRDAERRLCGRGWDWIERVR